MVRGKSVRWCNFWLCDKKREVFIMNNVYLKGKKYKNLLVEFGNKSIKLC